MEQVTVIGNIGKDAEIKVHNGNQFVSFSIAANKKFKNAQGEPVERTTWYNCITRQINLAQWLKKGTQVLVQGEPNNKVFKMQDGSWVVGNNVNCDNIRLLGSPNGGSSNNQPTQSQAPQKQSSTAAWVKGDTQSSGPAPAVSAPAGGGSDEDDLPF